MAPNIANQHEVKLQRMTKWPDCTPWRHFMSQISRESQALKDLKQEALVHYSQDLGCPDKDATPLNSVNHHFTVERVKAALELLNQDASSGLDGMEVQEYKKRCDPKELVTRVRSGRYRPKASRVVLIHKEGGTFRTLAIPCVEDRVVQGVWLLIIETVFEREFLDCSYGYRPDRNCHQALSEIAHEIGTRKNIVVLDADFKAYFDSVPHGLLMSFLKMYIKDPVFLKFCERTLRASLTRNGNGRRTCNGIPQGGVISPLFSNLFAHRVLDLFFERHVLPKLEGWGRLFRYADDFVVLTESQADAELARTLIEKHAAQHGLTLHPEKTVIRNMTSPELQPLADTNDHRELVFLGYELSWQQTAKAKWEVVGRTAPDRRAKAIERWKAHLDVLKANLRQTKQSHRRQVSLTFIEKLNFSIEAHIRGFAQYYCAEGNEAEIFLYEQAVFRSAAAFWRLHIDSKGSNPYEGDADRIWHTIRTRKMTELSIKS